MPLPHSSFADEFPHTDGLIHLNHAGVGPWPRRTAAAIRAFADENVSQGAFDYSTWLTSEQRLREQIARLINAPQAGDIALLKNTSEGLSVVAYGLRWMPGDNVVFLDQEFPSNRIVWESLASIGVEARVAPSHVAETAEAALESMVDGRTRLLAVSAVQFGTGLRMDLHRLGAFCRARGILFCVDAIQSLGALCMDVQAIGADFVMADGHKWLLAPEGLALFYCRASARDQLQLRQFGWHMVEHAEDFERAHWQPAASARRFECGSPNMLGVHALSASLSLLFEAGLEDIERRVINNANYLIDIIINTPGLELITPADASRHAGIVTFAVRGREAAAVCQSLHQRRILCAPRGGGVRFSPHFYTRPEQLEFALSEALRCR